ncbi:MAG: caspase family protein [Deltaproteobacteria bacterium]|nr:caspase family protein [Deltaproteobacteria bacterium]
MPQRACTALMALLALALAPAPSLAAQKRVALLVAHPFGGNELTPLRYTAHDLERMRDVLTRLGDFEAHDVMLSFGEDAGEVIDRFAEAQARLRGHSDSLFVFFYSGHAKDGELRLGESRLALGELKRRIESTGASLRVALLDACRSGSITRLKGASLGEPILMSVEDQAAQAGQVLITASSENEDAQESDDIQGSFFTHFLTTGLRGAADDNDDGSITLSEAYAFAYSSTVLRTVGTRGGIQHPTYRFDLRGAGDVVLTRPGKPSSHIAFPAEITGHFVVFGMERRVVGAELDKDAGRELRLAVSPGDYVVKKREADHLRMTRLAVHGAPVTVREADMEKVAFADDYAKGAVVTLDEVVHGKLGIRLALGVGAQTFLSAPVRDDYFPALSVVELSLDFHNLLRKYLGLRIDLGLGSSGPRDLVLEDPDLGELNYRVEVGQASAGASLFALYPLSERVEVGGSARLGLISVHRTFVDGAFPDQSFSTFTPGLGAEVGVRLLEWLRLGARVRIHYMFFNVDESLSLAYIDGGVTVGVVLR